MRSRVGALAVLASLLVTTACPVAVRAAGVTLPGKKLQVKQAKSGVQRLKMVAKDEAIGATTPCQVDGELAIQAVGGGLRVQRIPLAADRWEPIKASAPEKGCRYRKGPVAAKVVIRTGRSLQVVASASDLGVPLGTDPRPLRIELRHGDVRHCVRFGGEGRHTPDRRLVAKRAGAPTVCLSESTGHELIDTTGGLGNWVVWLTLDLTPPEYDALTPPAGWIRNQSRGGGGVGADGRFLRSPGRTADGEFTLEERFGVSWLHVTTVVGINGSLDPDDLLRASTVEKYHELTWRAGGSITVLTSPEGARYALVSRDARRTSDTPTIPAGWTLEAIPLATDLPIRLPLRTTVIRTDNEDSFQGPLPADLAL